MNASDVLKYGHLTFLASLRALPENVWETEGACGTWSVKDIVAHLASYELVLVDLLTAFLKHVPTPLLATYIEGSGDFNTRQIALRSQQTADTVLDELNEAHQTVLGLVEKLPVSILRQNGAVPWYGEQYCLEDLLVYMYYGHKREHAAQIDMFRDTLLRKVESNEHLAQR